MSPGIPTRLLATQSDDRLVALVRQGHERAFEALVHRYRKPLLGYCRRLRLSDARAEDIVQLALLKTWIAVREGAEVRDLKAWLYRVVHNTAVNALRDSAHEGEPFADPAHALEAHPPHQLGEDSQFDRGLAMREALAEVAALPPLQREVIVRTAVAGHSHEQVAADLGITNGAVRGLLYRARTTLRTAATVLTPPQLLGWLAGRSDQGGPAPERVAELVGGGGAVGVGGAAGVGGLLLKGGAVVLTVGTVLTGAAVVHLSSSSHHGVARRLIAAARTRRGAGVGAAADSAAQASHLPRRDGGLSSGAGTRGAGGHRAGSRADSTGTHTRVRIDASGGGATGAPTTSGGHGTPRSTTRVLGDAHTNASPTAPAAQGPAPGSTAGSGQSGSGAGSGTGSGQSGESGQGGGGSGSGGPVGSAAGNGSPGGAGASGSSGSSSEGSSSSGGSSGSGAGSGSGSGTGSSGSGSSGSGSSEGSGSGGSSSGSSGSSGSESSGSEQSGSLVGTVVHEVGSVLEQLLH
jgi:RNA polymerase sigma factor (sigma-70 family)